MSEDLLSQWEAEAKALFTLAADMNVDLKNHSQCMLSNRILALIDLVRKKDEALMIAADLYTNGCFQEALALTEELK